MSQSNGDQERGGDAMTLEAESTVEVLATDQYPKNKDQESHIEGPLEQAAISEIREPSSPVRIARLALALNEAYVNSRSSPTQDTTGTLIMPPSPARGLSIRQSPHSPISTNAVLTLEQGEGSRVVPRESPRTQEEERSVHAQGPGPAPASHEEGLILLRNPSSGQTELTSVHPQRDPQRELLPQELGEIIASFEMTLASQHVLAKSVCWWP